MLLCDSENAVVFAPDFRFRFRGCICDRVRAFATVFVRVRVFVRAFGTYFRSFSVRVFVRNEYSNVLRSCFRLDLRPGGFALVQDRREAGSSSLRTRRRSAFLFRSRRDGWCRRPRASSLRLLTRGGCCFESSPRPVCVQCLLSVGVVEST